MAGLVPAIHDLTTRFQGEVVDAPLKAGQDGWWFGCKAGWRLLSAPRSCSADLNADPQKLVRDRIAAEIVPSSR